MTINTTGLTDDSDADISIQELTFQKGNGGIDDGGGVYIKTSAGDVTVSNTIFKENAGSDGGAAYIETEAGSITVSGTKFMDNTSEDYGGGALLDSESGDVSVTGNTFVGNSVTGDYEGGGLNVNSYHGRINIANNVFTDNEAGEDAGGAKVNSFENGTIIIDNNLFTNNTAASWAGGLEVSNSSSNSSSNTIVTNNIFLNNTAESYAGGTSVSTQSPVLTNNVFIGNSSGSFDGGGARVQSNQSGTATITNNTFFDNSAGRYGGGLFIFPYGSGADAKVYNNIIWGNTAGQGGNDGDDLYADTDINQWRQPLSLFNNDLGENSDFVTGQSEDLYITDTENYTSQDNISVDPLFKDAANDDVHLTAGSPAINAGDNSAPSVPTTDFEGDARSDVDMGADEYLGPLAIPTLNEWGLILLALLISGASFRVIKKNRVLKKITL